MGHLAAPGHAARDGDEAGRAGLAEMVDGFRYVAMHKVLLVSFLIDIVAMGFGMPRVLFPEMAERTFGDPPGGGLALGLLFAAIPIGMVVGGAVLRLAAPGDAAGRRGDGRDLRLGVGVALFGLTHTLWLAVCSWPWPGRVTWSARCSGRRCCRRWRPTRCAAGCRACSSWWSRAARGSPTCGTGRRRGLRPRRGGDGGRRGRDRRRARGGGAVSAVLALRADAR